MLSNARLSRPVALHVALATCALAVACGAGPSAPPEPVRTGSDAGGDPGIAAHATATAPTVSGVVLETMDASSYTYVRVDTGDGEVWAAAPTFEVSVGETVVVPLEMPMEDFHSEVLDRDFDVVYFASTIGREGEPPGPVEMPLGHPEIGTREATVEAGAVRPAAGGLTVEQVWQRREALSGREVTVRGEVVKYNPGIMGTNWVHLQDGTGSPGEGTHDLTVTTDDRVQVGDVVTATGTVAVDRDFGSGYRYDVIVEQAEVEPG